MRRILKAVGLACVLVAPAGFAHELECIKEVNGEVLLSIERFPATLTYDLTVRNIHPDARSEVLKAVDPLLESIGFEGFDTPFWLAIGAEETKTFEVELENIGDCRELATADGTQDLIIENVFMVKWDEGRDFCTARVECEEEILPPGDGGMSVPGRMTGGGSVFGRGQNRITHGFQIRCDADDPRQNLEVNWQGNRFHLLDMTSATCSDDPALDEEMPVAGFDTYEGEGTGRYNGVDGATIEFTFTDDGEPGSDDTARMVIRDSEGTIVLDVEGDLNFGNHQAHP